VKVDYCEIRIGDYRAPEKKILGLHREDEEFKLAVTGLLELDTILNELRAENREGQLRRDTLIFFYSLRVLEIVESIILECYAKQKSMGSKHSSILF